MEALGIQFSQEMPTTEGLYFALMTTGSAGVLHQSDKHDEWYLNPVLVKLKPNAGHLWVQYSSEIKSGKIVPPDWHPVNPGAGWLFSKEVKEITFK